MHELSIVQGIMAVVERHLLPEPDARVKSVKLKLGDLAGIVPEALKACFDLASQGTSMAGAELRIERIPATYRCRGCRRSYPAVRGVASCPDCGPSVLDLVSGDEIDVVEMELETTGKSIPWEP